MININEIIIVTIFLCFLLIIILIDSRETRKANAIAKQQRAHFYDIVWKLVNMNITPYIQNYHSITFP